MERLYERQPQLLRGTHDAFDQIRLFSSEDDELAVRPNMNVYKGLDVPEDNSAELEELDRDTSAETVFHFDPSVHKLQANDDPELMVDGEFFDPDALIDFNLDVDNPDIVILD